MSTASFRSRVDKLGAKIEQSKITGRQLKLVRYEKWRIDHEELGLSYKMIAALYGTDWRSVCHGITVARQLEVQAHDFGSDLGKRRMAAS